MLDLLYSELSSTLNGIRKVDILILVGDINANVGAKNTDLEQIIGKYGLRDRDANGETFVDFCAQNTLVIGGTLFPH